MTREEYVKGGREHPSDFAFFGELDIYGEWPRSSWSIHRDSDVLDRANWESVLEALATAGLAEASGEDADAAGDYFILESSHWAVGWCKELFYRAGSKAETILYDLYAEACNYPVLDEPRYWDMEFAEFNRDVRHGIERWSETDELPAELQDAVAVYTVDELLEDGQGSRLEDFANSTVENAVNAAKLRVGALLAKYSAA